MPRIYLKKGDDARCSHLSVLMTREQHDLCRAAAKGAGFDSVSMWANMILVRAIQGSVVSLVERRESAA